ncbi:MAG: dockerin type I domain-containing protein [Acutalibacteraceae bacterium]
MKKKFKKLMSACLATLLLISTVIVAPLSASAAEAQAITAGELSGDLEYTIPDKGTAEIIGSADSDTESDFPSEPIPTEPTTEPTTDPITDINRIYFEVPDDWKNFKKIYCHIWAVDGSGEWPFWQTKAEMCTDEGNGLYSYDLSKTKNEIDPAKGVGYAVIFSSNTGAVTYNTLMSADCIGDTLYCTDVRLEGPNDSGRSTVEALWKNHPDIGVWKRITSTGNIVGTAHPDGFNDAMMLAEYIDWYLYSPAITETVPALMQELDLTSDEVYAACVQRYDANGYEEEEKIVMLAEIKTLLDSVSATTPDAPQPTVLGDVNGDGKVNVKDVTTIQKSAASIITLSDEQSKAADVNKDGKVNVTDATAIQKYSAGIETGLDIGK